MMTKKQQDNLIEIANAVKELNFGASQALPWCRESFPKLDAAMKEYEACTLETNLKTSH